MGRKIDLGQPIKVNNKNYIQKYDFPYTEIFLDESTRSEKSETAFMSTPFYNMSRTPTRPDVFKMIDDMIEYNESKRPKLSDWATDYYKEYCTVIINLGVGSGHTSYIVNRITNRDLLIVKHINRVPKNLGPSISRVVIDRININSMYNTIYVDNYSEFTPEEIQKIYSRCAFNERQTFVFLG